MVSPTAKVLVRRASARRARTHPGDSERRQPVHTVYGGAHLFTANTARKLGDLALGSLDDYAPDAGTFARALDLPEGASLHRAVYGRVVEKLRREPVEDLRIDFEDGYGSRSNAEEDGHAVSAAEEMAKGIRERTLPPFTGIRIKALTQALYERSTRTLELFVGTLMRASRRALPERFVVTLPKVTEPEQVRALAILLTALERRHRLRRGALGLEIMVETPEALVDAEGRVALPALVRAAGGRCVAAHFGPYDYTAALNVTASHQTMLHPACEFARQLIKVSLAGRGVMISDGPTNVVPVGPHRASKGQALPREKLAANREVVHQAWRLAYRHIRNALVQGIYQGWDLHPVQLPVRYAATYAFFLESLHPVSERLKAFVERAAQATRVGSVFDDEATGQGLLNFFLRGMACGALTEDDARETGLSLEEIRGRSFLAILEGRRRRPESAA
jgi:citrate lyase beta subunit